MPNTIYWRVRSSRSDTTMILSNAREGSYDVTDSLIYMHPNSLVVMRNWCVGGNYLILSSSGFIKVGGDYAA